MPHVGHIESCVELAPPRIHDDTIASLQLNSGHVLDEPEDGHLVPTTAQEDLELHESSLLLQMTDEPPQKPATWFSCGSTWLHEHLRHPLAWLRHHGISTTLLQTRASTDGQSVLVVPMVLGSVLVALSFLVCLLANTRENPRARWSDNSHAGLLPPRAGRQGWQDLRTKSHLPTALPTYAAPTAPQLRSGPVLADTKPQLRLKAPESEVSENTAPFSQGGGSEVFLPSARSTVGGGGAWVHVEYVVPQDSECCLCLPSLRNAVSGRGYGATGGFNEEVLFKVGLKQEGGKETIHVWSATGEILARSVPQPDGSGGWRFAIVDAQGRSHGVVAVDSHASDGGPHRFMLSEAIDLSRNRMVLRGNLQSEVAVYDLSGSLMAHFLAPAAGTAGYRAYLPQGADVCLLVLFLLSTERLACNFSGGRF